MYGCVLVATAASQSAAAAAETARADCTLAGNRRDAGLVTDADVLQIDVDPSRTREQQIRAAADERIARAQLNQLMGEPLGEVFALELYPAAAAIGAANLASLEEEAVKNRPDVKLAALQEQLAGAAQRRHVRRFCRRSRRRVDGMSMAALELALLELGRRRRCADERLSWIRRQGAARRAGEQAARRALERVKRTRRLGSTSTWLSHGWTPPGPAKRSAE